jgi:hypothetical protein
VLGKKSSEKAVADAAAAHEAETAAAAAATPADETATLEIEQTQADDAPEPTEPVKDEEE